MHLPTRELPSNPLEQLARSNGRLEVERLGKAGCASDRLLTKTTDMRLEDLPEPTKELVASPAVEIQTHVVGDLGFAVFV